MPYSQFKTITQAREAFDLKTLEGERFIPEVEPIAPSETLQNYLSESFPLGASTGSEKARSELIISPVLVEVRRLLNRQISVFSGEEFNVDAEVGLNGICDFLISRSSKLLEIEVPVVMLTEAKKADLKTGLGQCVAEMVAAQRFNQAKAQPIQSVYGCVTSGTQWRFLKLHGQTVTIDLTDYSLPPVEQILGFLLWMIQAG
ncbi:MAG: hypothetical protein F6K19_39150 [Cyanothece sp. SIO1E1]|nr:hypothetical protein [Cyanothece sp. SIO1E1]